MPGDVVVLTEGDTVAADARLLSATSLETSEAPLTGQSEPVLKDAETLVEPAVLGDRLNIVFKDTAVTKGSGRAVVTATAMAVLQAERVGQGCVLANPVFERIAHPSVTAEGRRATAMRFGDSRVQALAGALCVTVGAVTGITNKSLRALMTGLLGGTAYTMNQASYDLARLRVNGLITRVPGANRYQLTSDGLRFAIFYTKVHNRLLRPLLAADKPPAPPPLRNALRAIDIHITQTIDQARLLPKLVDRIAQIIDDHPSIDDGADVACSCGAQGLSGHSRHVADQIVHQLGLVPDTIDEVKQRVRYVSALLNWELTKLEGAE